MYLIGSYEVRPVKIGVSWDPAGRLKTLSTGSPVPLHLLWRTRGGAGLEAALHEYFAPYRIHGEWFDFQGENPVHLVVAAAARMGFAEWPERCAGPPTADLLSGASENQREQGRHPGTQDRPVRAIISAPDSPFGHPPEVRAWLTAQSNADLTSEEKYKIRLGAAQWARREVNAERQTQRSAGRILGVSHVTIGKWLVRDPMPCGDEDYVP